MEWKVKYQKHTKPAYSDLLDFFEPEIRALFASFDNEMQNRFKVHNKYHKFSNVHGWTYGYGRNYNCELLTVIVSSKYFEVLGVSVVNPETLNNALCEAETKYKNGFEQYCADVSAKRRENQIERSKKRVEREKAQMDELTESIDPDKLNKFKWAKKVSRNDLLKLYQSDAKGLLDEELLDEVGFTFYIRCKQAKEVRELMEKGRMLCLQCGEILQAQSYTAPVKCKCGYIYTYREYRRSCNAINMPGGRATPIFDDYMKKWLDSKTASQKMTVIDWLIHECHVTLMSGVRGRSVCVNLIEGTIKQISDLKLKLAYGS
ncbi:MAG: hypothetical protein LBS21_12920 [Clostridiales bacterium]|jgi:hypothetical protein|nr:hypothetical protein [Clostridiales bacterium]